MVSLCIYGLVIALAILFANTTHASHGSVHPCPPASALALCISLPLYLAIFWVASWALEVSPVAHACSEVWIAVVERCLSPPPLAICMERGDRVLPVPRTCPELSLARFASECAMLFTFIMPVFVTFSFNLETQHGLPLVWTL